MTARPGVLIDNAIGAIYDPAITLNLNEFELSAILNRAVVTTDPISNVNISGSLPVFLPTVQTGHHVTSFFDDFYNRIHIIPNIFAFGTLLAIDIRTFEVWNAFVNDDINLLAVTGPTTTASGVTVTSETLPAFFHSLESKEYSITADIAGPPSIDFTFTFDFDTPYDLDITTTGVRVSLWGEMPQRGWQEIYEWLTDVIEAYSGKKQFIRLRDQPRRGFVHNYSSLTHLERGRIDNKIRTTISNNYAVPVWSQFKKLTQDTLISTDTVYIDTTKMDIEVGSFVLLWNNDNEYEAGIIKTIDAAYLVLERAVEHAYLTNALCVPLILCYLPKEINQTANPLNKTDYSIKFKAKAGVDIAEGDLPDSYDDGTNDLDIFIDRSLIIGSNTKTHSQVGKRDALDNQTGIHLIDANYNYSTGVYNITKQFQTLTDAWNFRAWLQKMHGKQGAFWFPDYNETLEVVGTISSTATIVKVKDIELTDVYNGTPFITNIAIILKDGTKIFRGINSVGKNTPDEDILIDSQVGTTFTMNDVERIGLIRLVGISTDNLVFNFNRKGLSSISFNVQELIPTSTGGGGPGGPG